jgi:hydroxyethylthiazole kinase-like uncharacterized protein yjeF
MSEPIPGPELPGALEPAAFWRRLGESLETVPLDARTPPSEARVGAVLVLIEESDDGLSVVLTRRRRDLRSHPGQLSFPGGRREGNESLETSALREAHEEVGLDPDSAEVIGVGRVFYLPPSRFWVAPVLARWVRPHALEENPWEVDEILRVPLTWLLDPGRWRHAPLSLEGSTWAWQLEGDLLWGATAAVLAVLLDTAVPGWHGGREPHELGPERAVRPWETVPVTRRRPRLEGELPEIAQEGFPHVTAAQVRAVRAWLAEHGITLEARAEHAGRAAAHAVRRLSGLPLTEVSVTVLAGPSSNGAGGLAAARLLATAGAEVDVLMVGDPRLPAQVALLAATGIRIRTITPEGLVDGCSPGQVVIDAVLGIGAQPPLADLPAVANGWLRRHDVPVIALELPSGMSADTGLRGPCVTADVTVALGLPVVGLQAPITHAYVGDLYVADLGIPPVVWRGAGVPSTHRPPFERGPLVRLTAGPTATDAGTPDQAEVAG